MSRTGRYLHPAVRRRIHRANGPSPYTDRHCPQHKLGCSTERIAKQRAAEAFKRDGVQLRAYKCPYCHLWHLTSQIDPREKVS